MSSTVEDYPVVGSYNNQRFSPIDAERSVNVFEFIDPLGKKPHILIPTSGLENTDLNFTTPTTGGARAKFFFRGVGYVVFGQDVWRIDPGFIISQINIGKPLALNATGYVGIDANTYQIIFVDGTNGWIYDTNANTFERITDTAFPVNPIDVCQLDGFFVVAAGGTNTFQLSELNQGMVWGGSTVVNSSNIPFTANTVTDELTISSTDNFATGVGFTFSTSGVLPTTVPTALNTTDTFFAIRTGPTTIKIATTVANANAGIFLDITAAGTPPNFINNNSQVQLGAITSHPGTIVACRTLHRRLFLFSQFFTEVWENAGIGTNLPFRRNNSLLMEVGTPAIASIITGFDLMFFLAQDKDGLGSYMMVAGTESQPVSTSALDFQLNQYVQDPTQGVSDARSILIKDNGIIFCRLNFTAANHTFVYNVSMSTPEARLWHEEEVLNGDRHPAQINLYFEGNNYYGNYSKPILYRVDDSIFTNDGETIRRMRITKAIVPPGYQRIRIDRLQFDLLQGTVNLLEAVLSELDLLTETGFDIDTESGLALIVEQDQIVSQAQIVPELFLSISKDGGQSYGYVLRAPMGTLGQRRYRTLFRKLGVIPRGQAFVCKLEFYDAIPFVVLGGAWAFEVMPE